MREEIYAVEKSANDTWHLSKVCGIYLCELGNIIIYCGIYLCKLKNVLTFCEI